MTNDDYKTMPYGDCSIRYAAALIDSVFLFALNSVLQFAVFGSFVPPLPPMPADMVSALPRLGLSLLISIAVACSYETLFIGKMAATPGKMALGLKVIRPDGSRLSYGRAAGRSFARILSTFILGSGHIMMGIDSEKRALHDMICDSRVISVEEQFRSPLTGFGVSTTYA